MKKVGNINKRQRGNKTHWASKKRQKMIQVIIQAMGYWCQVLHIDEFVYIGC